MGRVCLVLFVVVVCSLFAATLSAADQPGFKTRPSASRAGDGATVSFAVSGPTDVAVDVVDGAGRVVRRLGGAALGAAGDPPPPFKPGLEQSIAWDGKDEQGKQQAGGPFRFRVRLGLSAQFDRFIGWEGMPPFNMNMCLV